MESPLPRSQHGAVIFEHDKAMIFGGYCSSKNLLLNDLWVLDTKNVPFANTK
jgi:hypothetical protein